jgi:hypothetical protein
LPSETEEGDGGSGELDAEPQVESDPDTVPAGETDNTVRGANKKPVYMDPSEPSELGLLELESQISIESTAILSKWWGQQIPFNSLVSSHVLVKNSEGKCVFVWFFIIIHD